MTPLNKFQAKHVAVKMDFITDKDKVDRKDIISIDVGCQLRGCSMGPIVEKRARGKSIKGQGDGIP